MPDGMFLRSDDRWHLDAEERHTFEAFVSEAGRPTAFGRALFDITPIQRHCPRWNRCRTLLKPLIRPAPCHVLRSWQR